MKTIGLLIILILGVSAIVSNINEYQESYEILNVHPESEAQDGNNSN